MAVSNVLLKDCLPAGVDLSAGLFKFVSINSSGQLILPTTTGNPVYGVVSENAPSSSTGVPVTVDIVGLTKVVAGATVAAGSRVMSNTSGQAVPVTTGLNAAGVARSGGAAGEVITVFLTQEYYA